MGRHYSLKEGNLYIFTTGQDRLIDLGVFPKDLNLFEAESDWRISPWIAVVENVLQKSAEMAQIILQLNDYEKIDVPSRYLDNYFVDGNEYQLIKSLQEANVPVYSVIGSADDASN